jgi:hypothetical protein
MSVPPPPTWIKTNGFLLILSYALTLHQIIQPIQSRCMTPEDKEAMANFPTLIWSLGCSIFYLVILWLCLMLYQGAFTGHVKTAATIVMLIMSVPAYCYAYIVVMGTLFSGLCW